MATIIIDIDNVIVKLIELNQQQFLNLQKAADFDYNYIAFEK